MHRFYSKYGNCILSFLTILLTAFLMGWCFDFYYDLNDDVMMMHIMSGVYSGVPDGHNMQTLYILGAFISFLYRLCRGIPWYGLFLCLCQFGSLFLIGARLLEMFEGRKAKAAVLIALALFQWSIFLTHIVNIQYTITCAMLSSAAIFLFVTTPEGLTANQFVKKNIPSVLLVILAYQLRTEMLLLTFPFIGLAGVFRWAGEKEIFCKENWQKYGAVFSMILLGMFLSKGVDLLAYGGGEWKDFIDFFEARTTVYDFYPEIITKEDYREALTELGVTSEQQALLRNYNYGLDVEIDTKLLVKIADYAKDKVGGAKDWGGIFKEQIYRYGYRIFRGDSPYNFVMLWAYAAVALVEACTVWEGKKSGRDGGAVHFARGVCRLAVLFLGRSAVWMFIMMRGREPERITHSLYLAEFAFLTAQFARMLCMRKNKNGILRGMAVLYVLVMAAALKGSISGTAVNQDQRMAVNENWRAVDEYCRADMGKFYFEDVYSTVSFSQKIFGKNPTEYANYDIIGGWMCKSPLYYEKLHRYGITNEADALLQKDNVFLIVSDTEAEAEGFDWLIDYYAAQNIAVTVEKEDVINGNYAVYRVNGL